MNCDICKMLETSKEFHLIYEDEVCNAFLHEAPANEGHAIVIPKKHYPILEEVEDKELEHMFLVANKISVAIFESLGAHGTNILINNGPTAGQEHAHIMIDVIPRFENDGLNVDWEMKQASPEQLNMAKDLITEKSDMIFFGNNGSENPISTIETAEDNEKIIEELRRIP